MADTSRDALFFHDGERLAALSKRQAWAKNPKYFNKTKISSVAAMKMLMHANSGVEKGLSERGTPVEVMGLMLGRMDTTDEHAIIVTDVFPLPVEGAETRVLADETEVLNYMFQMGESLEKTRPERFMGWYHSHPFDVDTHSHCFLSSTDVSTQLVWQRAEDHHSPWLAVVVDPLRSLAKGKPELEAFRVYPPDYSPPDHETPDGTIVRDESLRVKRWGSCWNRYYTLQVEYFMSSTSSALLDILSRNFLWIRTLSSTPMLERENRDRFAERITNVAEKLESDPNLLHSDMSIGGYRMIHSQSSSKKEESTLAIATQNRCELAEELSHGHISQVTKSILFNT